MVREYDKLVRDDVPDVVEANGQRPVVHTVDGEEYHDRLVDKLDEEVAEYREDRSVDELADVLEVVFALAEIHGVGKQQLADRRAQKAEERGGFDEGVVLDRVEE
ncbi:nucleoside triphosphate pyrophosphohydrolase [Halomarina rubra]|uniref:Phosphoribosyl-ATP pyrophosphohydrolase n=1 Tax=Halomarina rubra TaxID=2071873 RepID=A0ABD6AS67_9EURY|nr:nucleoside triphosphate pyrophosphohydrolase [Halomarina rubra]